MPPLGLTIEIDGLQLVQLKLQGHVLATIAAVVIGEAAARHLHVLAHVDAPCVVRVAGKETVGADFNGVGPGRWSVRFSGPRYSVRRCLPDVVIVVAVVPRICVGAHFRFFFVSFGG